MNLMAHRWRPFCRSVRDDRLREGVACCISLFSFLRFPALQRQWPARSWWILLFCLLAEVSVANDAQPEDTAPNVQLERTDAGAYRLQAGITIAAPLMVVWDVLTDCGQALRYIPGMLACEVLEAGENYDVARHRVRKYRLLPTLDYVFRSDYQAHELISVQLLEGDLETLHGQWQFASCGEVCTQISYDFTVESAWLVPGGIEKRALREDVPEMLKRLQQQSTQWFEQIQQVKRQAVN